MERFGFYVRALPLLLCAVHLHASEALPGERPLETDLKISGPAVYVRAPIGLYYRPGCLFPLQFRVHNPGAAFDGDVFVIEGAGDDGQRCGDFTPATFQPRSSRLVLLPVRAPAVTANLSVVVRGRGEGGGVPVQRFRARLRDLKPLPADARLILSVGRPGFDVRPGLDVMVSQSPREMLDEPWMYDSVDLVVLRDDAFAEARPAARAALRTFLLGGGRILLTSQSALAAAIAERLLPLEPGPIGAGLEWWQRHANLGRDGILAEKNNRPVYCRLKMGAGQVVFLFPATDDIVARDFGQAIFAHPALMRPREKLNDWRVQPERFGAFSFGQVQPGRVGRALAATGIIALMFCAVLMLALTSRSKLEAAGLPLALAALVAVLLAHWLPEPGLIASRVVWLQVSADGRAARWREWKLLESFRRGNEIGALAPEGGQLGMLFDRSDELEQAQNDLDRGGGRLRLDHIWVQPSQPALLCASRTDTLVPEAGAGRSGGGELRSRDQAVRIGLPRPLPEGLQENFAILVRGNGTLWALERLRAPGGFTLAPFENTQHAVERSLHIAGGKAKACAAALNWATREALRSKRDVLLCWGQPAEERIKSLVDIEPATYEVASSFFICSCEVTLDPAAEP